MGVTVVHTCGSGCRTYHQVRFRIRRHAPVRAHPLTGGIRLGGKHTVGRHRTDARIVIGCRNRGITCFSESRCAAPIEILSGFRAVGCTEVLIRPSQSRTHIHRPIRNTVIAYHRVKCVKNTISGSHNGGRSGIGSSRRIHIHRRRSGIQVAVQVELRLKRCIAQNGIGPHGGLAVVVRPFDELEHIVVRCGGQRYNGINLIRATARAVGIAVRRQSHIAAVLARNRSRYRVGRNGKRGTYRHFVRC